MRPTTADPALVGTGVRPRTADPALLGTGGRPTIADPVLDGIGGGTQALRIQRCLGGGMVVFCLMFLGVFWTANAAGANRGFR